MAETIILNGIAHSLIKECYVLGRSEGCDILLPEEDAATSRRHAMLERDSGGNWNIIDLKSTNGTFVNDRQIDGPHSLRHGDTIRIGRSVLSFVTQSPESTFDAGATFHSLPRPITGEQTPFDRFLKKPNDDKPAAEPTGRAASSPAPAQDLGPRFRRETQSPKWIWSMTPYIRNTITLAR